MFTTLLVANRGEIAARIFRTGRALGLRTVAVYSDADRNAYHVRQADEAVRIGPAPAAQSYLSIEAILQAACCSGTDAIHPGYGFLSENPALAEACAAAGITFVGPPAQAMRLLGDKPAARQLARQHGIPVLPGYDGESQDDATLTAQAHAIGFPVMIKAAAGGGGRGMRLAPSGEAMPEALASARREAQAAFGDGRLLLERAVVGGRHIEVQILADTRGHIIHLGERDCSVQRRFQKVIEESPSPAVAPSMREQLGAAAVAVARAAGYVNSGTIEFLLDAEGQFSFLEMNTRLQVEHGVTELVSGLDLVELQLRIAAGEAIDLRQADVALSGHAIECRIYAEDPSRGYLPSPGRITEFLPPAGDGVRNDVGVTAGSDVPAEYDPLLAKLLVQASTRAEAVARCAQALAGYVVEGVRTNLTLLRCVLADPVYIAGNADLTTLDRIPADAFVPAVSDAALLAAAVADLLPRPWAETGNVWDALGVWRVGGRVELSYGNQGRSFSVQTERRPATIERLADDDRGADLHRRGCLGRHRPAGGAGSDRARLASDPTARRAAPGIRLRRAHAVGVS